MLHLTMIKKMKDNKTSKTLTDFVRYCKFCAMYHCHMQHKRVANLTCKEMSLPSFPKRLLTDVHLISQDLPIRSRH